MSFVLKIQHCFCCSIISSSNFYFLVLFVKSQSLHDWNIKFSSFYLVLIPWN